MNGVGCARGLKTAAGAALAVLAAQYVPSTAVLAQWTDLEVLPRELCRFQGPRDGSRRVALTFDDGPDPEATPAILDELDRCEMRATFFPVAALAEAYPDLLAEVTRRGHAVGTHGYRHEHHLLHSPRWIADDLATAVAVMDAAGFHPTWYRPSYGQVTATTLLCARRLGMRPILWSAWGREWTTGDASAVSERIARRLDPGAVVLLHDNDRFGPAGMWRVARAAIEGVAREMRERRLEAVTLDELVEACDPLPCRGMVDTGIAVSDRSSASEGSAARAMS